MSISFLDETQALQDEIISRRRDLHKHPELAFQEVRTSGIVAQELNRLGLEVQTGIGKTGVIAVLEGDHDGPTVLVRADMDALPIVEANQVEYISSTPGTMHACGHDGHTSIGLAVAKMLSERRADIHGRIKFVFQPAEETGEGAKAMVADGALAEPHPDFSVGLHLWNDLPLGKIAVTPGPCMAAADLLVIKITGSGGHGASPHLARDPIVAAAQMISALQNVVSRNVEPLESAVVSITAINGGDTYNVIPTFVDLKGTVRTYKPEVQDLVHRRIREVCEGIASAMGCVAEVVLEKRTQAVVNNSALSDKIAEMAARHVGSENIRRDVRTMGAEDMSEFMSGDIPGCYFFVGSANSSRDLHYPHHNPRFDFDEKALITGAALLAEAAASFVIPE
jgi:amidohydrolase